LAHLEGVEVGFVPAVLKFSPAGCEISVDIRPAENHRPLLKGGDVEEGMLAHLQATKVGLAAGALKLGPRGAKLPADVGREKIHWALENGHHECNIQVHPHAVEVCALAKMGAAHDQAVFENRIPADHLFLESAVNQFY
jgi:hypothetical protein